MISNSNGVDTMKGQINILIPIVIVLILILAFLSVRIVNTGEMGVLLEFGKIKGILYPGIHFVVPFISGVSKLSVQIEKYEVDASAASKDLQTVQSTVAVNYRVKQDEDTIKSLWTNFRDNYQERIIQPMVQEAVKSNTAKYTADELLSKRTEVKEKISDDLTSKLKTYGIEVMEVSITNFDFSKEFNYAIEQKVVAEQTKLKEEFELQRKQIEVQKIIAEANATATASIINANAEAKTRLIKAEAEAKAIEQITLSLTNPYIRYSYVQKWNGQMPKVLGTDNL
ncbi:prohibitin family protein, partial [Candidatus Micrarchaeota archaeon]|nr:prohibitin family protein [Candidatus Micrarchaeota archaeon]